MNPKAAMERRMTIVKRLNSNMKALEKEIEEKVCRICFGGEEEAKKVDGKGKPKLVNPLISAC